MLADATVVRADDCNVQVRTHYYTWHIAPHLSHNESVMQLSAQAHWNHAMLSGVGTIDSHTLPDQVEFNSHVKI